MSCNARNAGITCIRHRGHPGEHYGTRRGVGEVWTDDDAPPSAKPPVRHLGQLRRALEAVARQMEYGDRKPGREPGDWRRRRTAADLAEKGMRHLLAHLSGELLDEDKRPHLVAAATDLLQAIEVLGS